MTNSWYQRLFPDTQLVSHALEELITTAGGYRLATSVGGAVTGRGANIIILDDPLKADEAMSDTQRDNVNSWYDSTLVSRLNDQRALGQCLAAIMSAYGGTPSVVDYARFNGQPALIVTLVGGGGRRIVVVRPECGIAGTAAIYTTTS